MERKRRVAVVAAVFDFEVEKMDVEIVDGWPKGNEIRMLLTQINDFNNYCLSEIQLSLY